MDSDYKVMITVRLPNSTVRRVDFVARNTDSKGIVNRSTAIRDALDKWLPEQEKRLAELGILPEEKAPKK